MTKVNVYSIEQKKVESMDFPKGYEVKPNMDLLAQAIRVYVDRQHQGTSKVKTRGEIALTSQKWFRQKGTGRARHGAQSAPIFVGGGKAHGPKGQKRQLKIGRKMSLSALKSAISIKLKEKKAVVIKGISGLQKTKEANKLLSQIESRQTLVLLSESNKDKNRVFRNLKNVNALPFSDLNAYYAYKADVLVFDADIFPKRKVVAKKVVKTKKENK